MNREQKIIEEIARGNEEAFKKLYETTSRYVYQYIFGLVKNKELAEDIMIETYAQVWVSAKRFKGDSKVLSWIFAIARNITMNEIKKIDYIHEDMRENEFDTPQQFDKTFQREIANIVSIALKKLPDKYREVLDLIFIHEFTYEDISKILKLPINTVKTRIFYAKEKLKNILKNMGIGKDEII